MFQQIRIYFLSACYVPDSGIQRQIGRGLSFYKGHCLVDRNTQTIMIQSDRNDNYLRNKMLTKPAKENKGEASFLKNVIFKAHFFF